jgi:hypothetical protein
MEVTMKANRAGRRAEHSRMLTVAVRVGLVCYGVMHLLIAWLTAKLALAGNASPSAQNAMSRLAQNTAGRACLFVVAVGFMALAVWQLVEAVGGHRTSDGLTRLVKRVTSGVKTAVFVVLAISAFRLAASSGSGSGGTDSMTAKLMSLPGGVVVVALVGVGVLVAAGALGYAGLSGSFTEKLRPRGKHGPLGSAIVWAGRVGYVGKAVAIGVVGALFVWAAWTHDPNRSAGLGQALHQVLQEPFGRGIVVVIAVGIASFGVFCFGWARHVDT